MKQNDLHLPFAHLNLTRNPFGQLSEEERNRIFVADVEPYRTFIETPGHALEFVAPAGRGKTSHLRALYDQFPDASFVRVENDDQEVLDVDSSVLFVDEFHFLHEKKRNQLYSQVRNLVIAAHVSFVDEMKSHGFDVRSIRLNGYAPETLRRMFERRIQYCRRTDDPVPRLSNDVIQSLIDRYADNVRAMEHHLYNVFQEMKEVRDIMPPDLNRVDEPPEKIVNPLRQPECSGLISKIFQRIHFWK